jgi:hypothetical protein
MGRHVTLRVWLVETTDDYGFLHQEKVGDDDVDISQVHVCARD